jgi:subtilisin family serine protease
MAEESKADGSKQGREYRLPGSKDDGKPPLPDGVGAVTDPGPGRRYLFRPNELLCPAAELPYGLEERLSKIATRVDGAELFQPAVRASLSSEKKHVLSLRADDQKTWAGKALTGAGLVKFKIDPAKAGRVMRDQPRQMPDIIELIRTGGGLDAGQSWQCWPNHLLTCQDYPEWGPGGPVERLPQFVPPKDPGDAGRGVTVAIVDTGVRQNHAWLCPKTQSRGPIDAETLDINGDGKLDPDAGHGTFVAGIVRQIAPGADIVVRGAVHADGCVEDVVIAGEILALSTGPRIDILNLSLGGYTHMNEGNGLPATKWALMELRRVMPRVTVVAAAGNDHRSDPFYPAALGDVIGVGALNDRGGRARFSNYGSWVDAWALGVDVVSSFVGQNLQVLGGGGQDGTDGARWSGTSFAAPRVAGALAAAISPASR